MESCAHGGGLSLGAPNLAGCLLRGDLPIDACYTGGLSTLAAMALGSETCGGLTGTYPQGLALLTRPYPTHPLGYPLPMRPPPSGSWAPGSSSFTLSQAE
jgi:hypothetical protein